MDNRFFVSAADVCLLQGRQKTVEKFYKLGFKNVLVQLFQVKIEGITPTLAWQIKTENGIFFYPVFYIDASRFNQKLIVPIEIVSEGNFFIYGSRFFKFQDGCILRCAIYGSQEIITAYALALGVIPTNLHLAKALHYNKVLALEWIFDDEEANQEFYILVFPDEMDNLRLSNDFVYGPLEFGYQELTCGEIYRHNDEFWLAKKNDDGLIELVLSPLSLVKS